MISFLDDARIVQLGFVVSDTFKAKSAFCKAFGFENDNAWCDLGENPKTLYKGKTYTDINCTITNMDFDNMQIEYIQPNDKPSVWRDWLNEHGEGLHHFAYAVTDMDESISKCENRGMKLKQRGLWPDGGGCYAYFEIPNIPWVEFELLQEFEK